jgi:hypothetical protein
VVAGAGPIAVAAEDDGCGSELAGCRSEHWNLPHLSHRGVGHDHSGNRDRAAGVELLND